NISEENGNFDKIKKLPTGTTIFLPKSWTVDLDLAWSAGFYYAEGSRLKNSIGISNCYLPLLFKFRKFVNSIFNFQNEEWHVMVRTKNTKLKEIENKYRKLFGSNKVKTYIAKIATHDNIEIRINNVPL